MYTCGLVILTRNSQTSRLERASVQPLHLFWKAPEKDCSIQIFVVIVCYTPSGQLTHLYDYSKEHLWKTCKEWRTECVFLQDRGEVAAPCTSSLMITTVSQSSYTLTQVCRQLREEYCPIRMNFLTYIRDEDMKNFLNTFLPIGVPARTIEKIICLSMAFTKAYEDPLLHLMHRHPTKFFFPCSGIKVINVSLPEERKRILHRCTRHALDEVNVPAGTFARLYTQVDFHAKYVVNY